MAPAMSLSRATGRPASGLTSSRRRSTTRRTVAAQATSDDRPNAALLTLSAGALLAQSAVVDPAAAAQLSAAPDQGVLIASQITTSHTNKYPSATAPGVRFDDSNITRTSSGPEANMNDPDAYFDQVDRMEGRQAAKPAVRFQHVNGGYVEATLPAPVLGEVADLNADVRDIAKDYRDPAGAIQQDKFADKVKSGPSLGSKDLGDSVKSGLKDVQKKATKGLSALPTPAVGDLADLNADVRDLSKNYRDPAGAIQQDKFADKVQSGPSLGSKDLGDSIKSGLKDVQKKATDAVSSLPTPAVGDLADLNADVRGASKNYRDPAGAVQQDKFADKVKSGPSLGTKDLGSSVKSGLKDVQRKATRAVSELPTPAIGDLADLNTDVRGVGSKVAGAASDAVSSSSQASQSIGEKIKDALTPSKPETLGEKIDNVARDNASNGIPKFNSALPTPAVGDLADLNADVRGASKNYRDPAGAVQQDKFADKVKSGPSLGTKDLGSSVKSGLKDAKRKATRAVSELPTPAIGDLADLNTDVRDVGSKVAGAASDAVSSSSQASQSIGEKIKDALTPSKPETLGEKIDSVARDNASNGIPKFNSALPTPAVGDLADLNADVRGASKNYRDPAGAVQQDKFADKVKSGPSLGTKDLGSSVKSGLKDAKRKATRAISELATPAIGDLADLNADVRDTATDYRDPAVAVPQDKVQDALSSSNTGIGSDVSAPDLGDAADAAKSKLDKASKMFSAVPASPAADLADLNADVRDIAKDYRDPAGAIQQDKFADKVKSGPSLGSKDLGDSVKSGLKDVQKKATKGLSALPTPAVGDLADLNADVRDLSKNYRDPAGAIQQDKFADKVQSGPSLGSKDLGDSIKSGLKDVQKKATDAVSSLPTPAVGDLADLNADVRGASKNYRDPAGAVQQDKFADRVKSGPSLGTKDLGSSVKSGLKDAKRKATRAVSELPTPAIGDLADLNADVRDTATDYRDPAIAVPQDKVQDALSDSSTGIGSGVSAPDLGDAADAAKSKLDKASKIFSAVPASPAADLADLNADVRDIAKDYRDPAGAIQQDKFADKVKSGPSLGSKDLGDSVKSGLKDVQKKATKGLSALPTPAVGDLADLNADVRDLSKNYRDPAGAIQQDKFADKVQSGPSLGSKDLGDSIKSGLKDVQKKATDAVSTLPTLAVGDLADLNADVRDLSKNYRDPAGAIQQDKFADKVQSGPSLGSKDLGDSIKSGLKDVQKKATDAVSSLPTPAVGDLADLNADVRGASKNYRDPAGAVQQDKFADKVKSGPSLGTKDLGSSVKSGLKDAKRKATRAVSELPTPAIGDLADLNADVRGDAADYRDPAGAVQQDTAAGAVKSKLPGLPSSKPSGLPAKKYVKKVVSNVTQDKREIGVKAGYGPSGSRVRDSTGKLINADDVRGTDPPIGNARLSQPLVRDSVGVKRVGSKNQTGAAGGADSRGVVKPLQEVVDRVAN